MIVVIGDTKLHITWRHLKDETERPGQTECIISTVDANGDRHPLAVATVGCYFRDKYSKNKGRKISMTRALSQTSLASDQRRLVWEAYGSMRGGKY